MVNEALAPNGINLGGYRGINAADGVDPTDLVTFQQLGSVGGVAVPTVMLDDEIFEIPDRRQALFAYPITGGDGSMILQGEDSILIGVS